MPKHLPEMRVNYKPEWGLHAVASPTRQGERGTIWITLVQTKCVLFFAEDVRCCLLISYVQLSFVASKHILSLSLLINPSALDYGSMPQMIPR